MTTEQTTQDTRDYKPKIYRVDAKGKVLDFQDFILLDLDKNGTLEEGKIVLNYTEYDVSTHKAKVMLKHYIDMDTARRIFSDILNYRFKKIAGTDNYEPLVKEFKGGKGSAAGHDEWEIASRVLTVTYQDKINGEPMKIGPVVSFNLVLSEGVASDTGAIKPKNNNTEIKGQIMVPLQTIRSAAATVLDYITCSQTSAMGQRRIDELEDRLTGKVEGLETLIKNLQKAICASVATESAA